MMADDAADVPTPDPARCPACGAENGCSYGTSEPCWCATTIEWRVPLTDASAACYCRRCLEALIAQTTATGSSSTAT